jgi:ubiquitin-protein ligase
MSNRARRITKEIADIHADTSSHIIADIAGNGDDLSHLKGSFRGPPGTPYEGGSYTIDIKIPNEYPFRPPVMRFETKVWHPNVSSQTVRGLISISCLCFIHTNGYCIGCYLPRHTVLSLVTCSHHQIGSSVPTILT